MSRSLNVQDFQQRRESIQKLLEVYDANPECFNTPLVTGNETCLQILKKRSYNGSALTQELPVGKVMAMFYFILKITCLLWQSH